MRDVLKRVRAGDFTDTDLALAKTNVKSQFKQSYDSAAGLSLRALRTALFNVPFNEKTMLQTVEGVGKDTIVRLAQKLQPLFHYRLGKEEFDAND